MHREFFMSFNQKATTFSIFLIVLLPLIGIWYYKKSHPVYVPLPPRPEVTLTIIPGWNLRQIADYLVEKGFASTTEDVFKITGKPAAKFSSGTFFGPSDDLMEQAPAGASMEGYLAPETIRVFADASLAEGVIDRFYFERVKEITPSMYERAKELKQTMHQILTMASIIEKEVKYDEDREIVSDILWRRLAKNWALQVDSSVHYLVDRSGDVFTTEKEREIDSLWNTYKYPGLPPGPIANPSVKSIQAALYPEKNTYWYFLSDKDGHMHYASTLDEHNANRRKY